MVIARPSLAYTTSYSRTLLTSYTRSGAPLKETNVCKESMRQIHSSFSFCLQTENTQEVRSRDPEPNSTRSVTCPNERRRPSRIPLPIFSVAPLHSRRFLYLIRVSHFAASSLLRQRRGTTAWNRENRPHHTHRRNTSRIRCRSDDTLQPRGLRAGKRMS